MPLETLPGQTAHTCQCIREEPTRSSQMPKGLLLFKSKPLNNIYLHVWPSVLTDRKWGRQTRENAWHISLHRVTKTDNSPEQMRENVLLWECRIFHRSWLESATPHTLFNISWAPSLLFPSFFTFSTESHSYPATQLQKKSIKQK